jgi:hypothetical protein
MERKNDINIPNKSIENKNKKEKLSEREIKELMSHSSYRRHRGAMKQVNSE